MSNASIDQARLAKPKAGEMARQYAVVTGIGITKVGNSYAVKVNLRECPKPQSLPCDIDGVPVVYEVIGRTTAQ